MRAHACVSYDFRDTETRAMIVGLTVTRGVYQWGLGDQSPTISEMGGLCFTDQIWGRLTV